ncbi:pyrroline-5-carboxylate reductase [Geminocystis sp. NIES-3709]|uniref:pyrroline-5-carboxylate reductase n=1 Tax=Geminocystis sp. NIES-3709 TaxID=1617448 RepID=UPI0005FCB81C|nr:pyrroline-5-carboxylate reductase [Geminocystis sp. NIES-3709]BAQ66708.1 pyrroline-5-carboxylate reductase [Geminocystis sp. NIES-3709]
MSFKLGIIGGGVMAEAIISRLLQNNIYSADSIIVSEPLSSRRQFWQDQYGVSTTGNNQDILDNSEVLLLAIKPQIFNLVISNLHFNSGQKPLILSILAGVSLAKLANGFPDFPIVRVMPNTPAMVGQAMTALSPNKMVTETQLNVTLSLFSAIGSVISVPEYLMDGVTGLSGSGPAFVALMIEALADGGVASGLPRSIALQLATQTVLGTAELIKQQNLHPAILKDQVTSPGGTTIAGVAQLEENGFRHAVISAVTAAYKRSQELGK